MYAMFLVSPAFSVTSPAHVSAPFHPSCCLPGCQHAHLHRGRPQVEQLGPPHLALWRLLHDSDFFQVRRVHKELHLYSHPLDDVPEHERGVDSPAPDGQEHAGEGVWCMLEGDGDNGARHELVRGTTGEELVEHLAFLGCRDGPVEVLHEALTDTSAGWGWKGWRGREEGSL